MMTTMMMKSSERCCTMMNVCSTTTFRRLLVATHYCDENVNVVELMKELRTLDTACICDADKMLFSSNSSSNSSSSSSAYKGIRVLNAQIRPINHTTINTGQPTIIMVGIARTVRCTKRNDFLAVLRGLVEAQKQRDDLKTVLMVDTCDSNRAVAGCSSSLLVGTERFAIIVSLVVRLLADPFVRTLLVSYDSVIQQDWRCQAYHPTTLQYDHSLPQQQQRPLKREKEASPTNERNMMDILVYTR
jgi:hypothetical protein